MPGAHWAFAFLCDAARAGSTDIFLYLVGIDGFLALARGRPGYPEDQQRRGDRKILDEAARGGSDGILATLLDIDDGFLALVGMRDEVGDRQFATLPKSPLHWAALGGHARIAAALVEAGAPLEYKYNIGGVNRRDCTRDRSCRRSRRGGARAPICWRRHQHQGLFRYKWDVPTRYRC